MAEHEHTTEHEQKKTKPAVEQITETPAQPAKEDTITITKTNLWQLASGILIILLAASIFTSGFGYGGEPTGKAVAVQPSQPSAPRPTAPAAPTAPVEVNLEGAHVQGDEDAPVTLIEFSDFQCPFCGRFFSQTKSQIDEQYVKTGKVKFVYMHFPLDSLHPQARPAALASECAGEQGKFWEFHDIVFQNQQSLGDTAYKQWAQQLGLDTDQFNECYDSGKYASKVQSQLQQGQSAGIRGTPGFLLNGKLISGAQPFAAFQQAIEAELAN